MKRSPEQLGHANEGETAAWEQIDPAMQGDMGPENRGGRKCEDLTKQGDPPGETDDGVTRAALPEPV